MTPPRPRHPTPLLPAAALSPSLPGMPDPPALERYLFENPWPAIIVLVLAGVILFFGLRRTGKLKAGGVSALAALVIAGGVYLTASLVRTEREHLRSAAGALVDATASADRAALTGILDPDVRVRSAAGSPDGREQVIALVERYIPRWNLGSVSTREVNSALEGDDIAWSQVNVRIRADMVPPNSWWRLDWAKDPAARADDPFNGWRVTKIEPLWMLGVPEPGG